MCVCSQSLNSQCFIGGGTQVCVSFTRKDLIAKQHLLRNAVRSCVCTTWAYCIETPKTPIRLPPLPVRSHDWLCTKIQRDAKSNMFVRYDKIDHGVDTYSVFDGANFYCAQQRFIREAQSVIFTCFDVSTTAGLVDKEGRAIRRVQVII